MLRAGAAVLALGLIAGCAGGTGSPFADLQRQMTDLNSLTALSVAPQELPPSGTADFAGVVQLTGMPGEPQPLYGAATAQVDFGAGTVSGGMDGFVNAADEAWEGSAYIVSGAVRHQPGAPAIGLNVYGALRDPEGGAWALQGDLVGDFTGTAGIQTGLTLEDDGLVVQGQIGTAPVAVGANAVLARQ